MHGVQLKTRIMRCKTLLLITCLLFMTGCGRSLLVIDEIGQPVVGAEVVVAGLSTSGTPSITDKQGIARLNNPVQQPMSISIHKEGVGSTVIAYPSRWPVKVTLTQPKP